MYIEPNTNIKILKGVPLDTTYDHTIYFADEKTQYTYFAGLQKYNLTNYTYQRVNLGVARVSIKSESLYDCNYMMFQNTSYGNKWFYAFITAVEFVNNECSEIHFELDVMQTWFFDCEPDYCFVEREHTKTDNIGDNIVPENVECGEYIYRYQTNLNPATNALAIVAMISDVDEAPEGNMYDGMYSGCTLKAFNPDDKTGLSRLIENYYRAPESIVSLYTVPISSIGGAPLEGGSIIGSTQKCRTLSVNSIPPIDENTSMGGYIPKNKKMFTYPYTFFTVSTGKNSSIYRYEFFEGLKPQFEIDMPIMPPVQYALRPVNYKGVLDTGLISETLILDDFPLCSWSTDTFKAWLAQNSAQAVTTAGVTAGVATATAIGVAVPPLGIAMSVASVANLLSQGYKASISADVARGNTNCGNVNASGKKLGFYSYLTTLTPNYAKIIDDYFTKFGYAVKELKKPNRNSRPHWNYVKTINATVTGSVPADDMKKICSIYDNGITFWKKGSEVGEYNLDNTV